MLLCSKLNTMLGISNRLVQAQQASFPTKHEDDQQRIAGRQAEKKIFDLLTTLGGLSSSNVFRALRIPDEFQTRRHEIDLVIVFSYGMYCIEIKNWRGAIKTCQDPLYWEQVKVCGDNKHSTRQVQYFNPVTDIRKKSQILRNHLLRAGICLNESKFFPRVILINEHCTIDEAIKEDKCVITHETLNKFITSFERSFSEIITDPLIPYFVRGQLSYAQIDQIRSALNQIGTWDILNLNGGKILVGDYKGCTELSFNRKDVEEIMFLHQRNVTTASIWAILGYAPKTTVVLYKRGGSGWFGRETTASIVVPYNHDISFRIAGETTDAKIPANDISNIVLSN